MKTNFVRGDSDKQTTTRMQNELNQKEGGDTVRRYPLSFGLGFENDDKQTREKFASEVSTRLN